MTNLDPNTSSAPAADIRLYTPAQVLVATVFGLPLAAGWLMAANYDALDRPVMKTMARIFGFAATAAYVAAFFALAWGVQVVSLLMSVGICLAMYGVARLFQGSTIAEHRASGGRRASYLKTIAVSFICLVVILIVVVPLVLAGLWAGVLELPAMG